MPKGYTVTDVMERIRFTTGGREVKHYDISIVTALGATGTISVPEVEYTKENIPKLLEDLRGKLDVAFEL